VMAGLQPGLTATVAFVVGDADTANVVGSGDVPVLATPRLLAWMEHVTVQALAPVLAVDVTTVGSRVDLEHLRPSAVGTEVTVVATVSGVHGRLVECDVVAADHAGRAVGQARVTRVVVERERFLARLT